MKTAALTSNEALFCYLTNTDKSGKDSQSQFLVRALNV